MSPRPHLLAGQPMEDAEIDRLLAESGVGVLSMCSDGVPYGIPLSFGYDRPDRIYFLFVGRSDELQKETYAEQAEVVSFLVYDIRSIATWRSVIATGTLEPIGADEWATARETMVDNAFRGDLFSGVDPSADPNAWVLEIDAKTGRISGPL